MPDVLPIDPHDADHVTSAVAENCRASFTMTVGFVGSIWNAAAPEPESATVCGLLLAESANASVAVRVPDTVGLNTTLTEQLAAAARLVPQVWPEIAKSPGLLPPMLMLLMVMEELVPLLSLVLCAALVEPTAIFVNPRLVGDTVTLPDAVPPVPVRLAVCGLLLAVSETVNVAARDPDTVGLKTMLIVQPVDAARLLPHVLLAIVKSPGFVPVKEMLLIVIAELVLLASVAVCDALVEPTLTDPNEKDVGLMETVLLRTPVPESATVCGLLVAESLKFSVAVRVPVVVGAKVMFAVQLPDAARLLPH